MVVEFLLEYYLQFFFPILEVFSKSEHHIIMGVMKIYKRDLDSH